MEILIFIVLYFPVYFGLRWAVDLPEALADADLHIGMALVATFVSTLAVVLLKDKIQDAARWRKNAVCVVTKNEAGYHKIVFDGHVDAKAFALAWERFAGAQVEIVERKTVRRPDCERGRLEYQFLGGNEKPCSTEQPTTGGAG